MRRNPHFGAFWKVSGNYVSPLKERGHADGSLLPHRMLKIPHWLIGKAGAVGYPRRQITSPRRRPARTAKRSAARRTEPAAGKHQGKSALVGRRPPTS